MSKRIYWIFVLFCGIILFEMTGCSNKIEILSFESNPAKFSPDGDGVDETTTISCKTRSTVLEGVFSSQDELIVKYNFTIVDDRGVLVFDKGIESKLDRSKAVKNGSNYEIEDDVSWEWDGRDRYGNNVADGRYEIRAIGELYRVRGGSKEGLAESEVKSVYVEKVSSMIEITGVQPVDGEVILYSAAIDMIVFVSGDVSSVVIGNRYGQRLGEGRYIFRGIPLKKGINEIEVTASGVGGISRKVVRYESLQVVGIGSGLIKREEGGIIIGGRGNDIELRVRANSISRDARITIKETGAVARGGGVMLRNGIEIDTGGAGFEPEAELIGVGVRELAEVSGSEITDGVVMDESGNVYGSYLGDNKVVGKIKGGGRYLIQSKSQSNLGIRRVIGGGSIEPIGEEVIGELSRLPSSVKSMKRDGLGNLYILSGDKIYRYNTVSNRIKRLIDLSNIEGGFGGSMSMAVSGDGRKIYVAYGIGYIVRFDIDGDGVGSASKINGTEGGEEPRDGGILKSTLFLAPRGVEISGVNERGNIEVVVVDSLKREVYKVEDSSEGVLSKIAGVGWDISGVDTDEPVDARKVRLDIPTTGEIVIVNDRRILFFADRLGHRVRAINLNSHSVNLYGYELPAGYIMTVAGKKCNLPTFLKMFCGGYSGDGGLGREALLRYPSAVSYDRDKELLYIMDAGNGVVRALTREGYITTIAGGGDKSGEFITARENVIDRPNLLVYAKSEVSSEIDGGIIKFDVDKIFYDVGNLVNVVEKLINVDLRNEDGVIVKSGMVRWDGSKYNGDRLRIIATSRFSTLLNFKQVICREGLSGNYAGGVFDVERGCNKFGGDYISSMRMEDCNETGCYEVREISGGKEIRIKRNQPGRMRFEFRLDYEGKTIFRHLFDVPWKLGDNAIDIGTGVQLDITNDEIDMSDKWSLWFFGVNWDDIPHICPERRDYDGYSPTKGTCYIDTNGYLRVPYKSFMENFPYVKECYYHLLAKEIGEHRYDTKVLKRCVDLYCITYPDIKCDYVKGSEREDMIEKDIRKGSEDDYSDGSFYNPMLARKILSGAVDRLLNRMKERGMSDIQITYEGAVTRGCKEVRSVDNGEIYECSNWEMVEGENKYPIIEPVVPYETKDMIIDMLLEKNRGRGIIKRIFIKPSLMPDFNTYRYRSDPDNVLKDKNEIVRNIGPLSRKQYNRLNPIQRGYYEDKSFDLWNIRSSSEIGWEEILKKDTGRLITIGNNGMENLYEDFYTGGISTCGPKVRIVNKDNQNFYKNDKPEGCEYIKVRGDDCDAQMELGIYNYYCFLRSAVRKGRMIKDRYGDEVEVYISLSNDHIAPALPLSMDIKGMNLLDELKNLCSGCKFTNALVVNQLNFNADEFWKGSIPYIYDENTYKSLMTSYLTSSIFGDTGFGLNAYGIGNCISRSEQNTNKIDRFCKGYGDYMYQVNCYDSEECKNYKKDIHNIYAKEGVLGVGVGYDCEGKWNKYTSISLDEKVCLDNGISCGYGSKDDDAKRFYRYDPPFTSKECDGIYECYSKYYRKYIVYIRDILPNIPLFISEIGSPSGEMSAYNPLSITFGEWTGQKHKGIYGITNIKDYQEQVDMIEAGIASIMGNQDLLGGKKLKGIIIFSDSLAESPEDLDWQFPVKWKPAEKYLKSIGR